MLEPGRVGSEEAELRDGVKHHPRRTHALHDLQDLRHDLRELDVGGREEGLIRRVAPSGRSAELVDVEPLESPAVRRTRVLQVCFSLRERDEETYLSPIAA